MHRLSDPQYLREQQYRNESNLDARIALHQRFGTNPGDWHRWVFDQLALPGTVRILEVGCGTGRLWSANRDRIPDGWDVTLTDFSAGMLEAARRNLRELEGRLTFAVADAMELPEELGRFDAVIANHMLYHVPDRPRALAQIAGVLQPASRLYAATNGRGHLNEIRAIEAEHGLDNSIGNDNGFTLEDGAAQLQPWFEHVELRYYDDALYVTEAAPLVAYIRSEIAPVEDTDSRLTELTRDIQARLARDGAFHVSKFTGLFIAAGARSDS
jgi:ubiquinone/menaquinone biosynthesis C-methylase UbiE